MATNDTTPILRLTFLSVVIAALFVALFSRLWFVQVLAGDRYLELADTNRLRTVVTEAPRGAILASGGEVLVRNRPALTISADRRLLLDDDGEPRDEQSEAVIGRLAELLRLDREVILERLASQRRSPFRPVPIEIDVAPEVVFAVREHQELFPGVIAETLPVRFYPYGNLAAHMVGYTGEISSEELADPRYADYRGGDIIGRGGLEEAYEQDLRGTAGQRILEVNTRNVVLDVLRDQEPEQGHDLVTTIDLDLQRAVEELLEDGVVASREVQRESDGRFLPSTGASAVVLDVHTGAVRALASYPSFDPSEFVGGVSREYWTQITDRDNHTPLFNRVIAARHPPGSVFKIVSGAAYLRAGIVTPGTTVRCAPEYQFGNVTFRNWNRGVDEGPMELATALMRSCDTYFYQLAEDQWHRERTQLASLDKDVLEEGDIDEAVWETGYRFGMGRRLGIDLPGEQPGYIPNRVSKQQRWLERRELWCAQAQTADTEYARLIAEDNCLYGGQFRGGDAVNTSIGQGEIETTPLQVAAAYMAIANGGTVYRPHVGHQVVDRDGEVVRVIEPEVVGELDLDDTEIAAIRDGLERVVQHERGTANGAFLGFPLDRIPVAGKTGTAEQRPKVPFAWFVAYAPADDPEVVIAVNVEEGGGGSQTAAPIVRAILEYLYDVTPMEEIDFEAGPEIYD